MNKTWEQEMAEFYLRRDGRNNGRKAIYYLKVDRIRNQPYDLSPKEKREYRIGSYSGR